MVHGICWTSVPVNAAHASARTLVSFLALLCAGCGSTDSLADRGVEAVRIEGPFRESFEGFTEMRSVVELPDGSALVLDYLDRSLHRVEFEQGTRRPISRIGRGPGEYESPRTLLPWHGDSVLLVDDAILNKLIGFTPDATADGTLRTGHEETNDRFYASRTASDTMGNVYAWIALRTSDRRGIRLDSAAIERTSLSSHRRDTIMVLDREEWAPGLPTEADRDPTAARPFGSRSHPFGVADQYVVFPNGNVAVVHPNPYRVTTRAFGGSLTLGPVLVTAPIPVTEELKKRWRQRASRLQRILRYGASAFPQVLNEVVPAAEPEEWPSHLPPFQDRAVFASPDGLIFVERSGTEDSGKLVDVISMEGTRVRQLSLPAETRLLAVSWRYLYLIRTDADDLEFLQRWPRPM